VNKKRAAQDGGTIQHLDMDQQGSKRVEVTGANDKRLITALFCGSLVGDFLLIQVIYQGKTPHCHPRYQFPPVWDIHILPSIGPMRTPCSSM